MICNSECTLVQFSLLVHCTHDHPYLLNQMGDLVMNRESFRFRIFGVTGFFRMLRYAQKSHVLGNQLYRKKIMGNYLFHTIFFLYSLEDIPKQTLIGNCLLESEGRRGILGMNMVFPACALAEMTSCHVPIRDVMATS